MGILILTQPMPPQPFIEALQRELPGEALFTDLESARARAAEIETALLWRLEPGVLEGFSALRFVAASAAGVDKILGPQLPAAMPLTRTVDPEQNLQIAQYVCTMVLRHVRQAERYEAQQRERAWVRHDIPAPSSVTVGVLGLGESGRVVAAALTALGFPVLGWSRSAKQLPGVESFQGPQGLASMLPRCQVLVCLLPLTAETEGIVDAGLLAQLPPGAFFVNVARGSHVVEADLAAALRAGRLAGAALDVQGLEPLPPDDPLWEVPQLTITPHVASTPAAATVAAQLAENLRRARGGQPLLRTVDPARGY